MEEVCWADRAEQAAEALAERIRTRRETQLLATVDASLGTVTLPSSRGTPFVWTSPSRTVPVSPAMDLISPLSPRQQAEEMAAEKLCAALQRKRVLSKRRAARSAEDSIVAQAQAAAGVLAAQAARERQADGAGRGWVCGEPWVPDRSSSPDCAGEVASGAAG
eukprot:TRINITY_DN14759_c0_g1_i1.p1 TRINITY_DN14759_c0_g1~~TRINITY_DN14759_c0_g1_i1.p1  ORF type:complete len:163 (+),score=28.98 TRINITY_DN14759_c0_g1_i1:239-727(+)